MKTIDEMIAVMTAFKDGKKIEAKLYKKGRWDLVPNPFWDWVRFDYRVAFIKPSVDWTHVSDEYNWIAIDEDGKARIYSTEPSIIGNNKVWSHSGKAFPARVLTSFDPGSCDWRDSLVKRPENNLTGYY
jgi:hypothetical protein